MKTSKGLSSLLLILVQVLVPHSRHVLLGFGFGLLVANGAKVVVGKLLRLTHASDTNELFHADV